MSRRGEYATPAARIDVPGLLKCWLATQRLSGEGVASIGQAAGAAGWLDAGPAAWPALTARLRLAPPNAPGANAWNALVQVPGGRDAVWLVPPEDRDLLLGVLARRRALDEFRRNRASPGAGPADALRAGERDSTPEPPEIPAAEAAALAARFFAWASPASIAEFAAWAGIATQQAAAAAAQADLRPIEVLGWWREAWVPADRLPQILTAAESPPGHVCLLPRADNYLAYRLALSVFLGHSAAKRTVLDASMRPRMIGSAGSLAHNVLLEDGELTGVWEFNPESRRIEWTTLLRHTPERRLAVENAAALLEHAIETDPGLAPPPPPGGERARPAILSALRRL